MIKGLKVKISGAVQGVGFRPYIYRLALGYGLVGQVFNTVYGICIEVDGEEDILSSFLKELPESKPVHSVITNMESSYNHKNGFTDFQIVHSESGTNVEAILLPDLATCDDCTRELFDTNNRRYLYPFINCTNCGPRFTIIESLPYDRIHTSMKTFLMCDPCGEEFNNPLDRRFHAQPTACPDCGPQVSLLSIGGDCISEKHSAIEDAVELIKQGLIIAVKGLGGFHIICRTDNPETISRLRKRKHRQTKPFAVMFPDLESVRLGCFVSDKESELLQNSAHPITLLKKKYSIIEIVQEMVAPGNPSLGVMLPYTPLHKILMKLLQVPVIATSANLADETVCITDDEVFSRLSDVVDFVLTHNRPILRHADDSIARIFREESIILRRARGYAPMPVPVSSKLRNPIIALGSHLKNTFTINANNNLITSQHIGDLSSDVTSNVFLNSIKDFSTIYNISEPLYVKDLHPDYLPGKFARPGKNDAVTVQHHIAHIASCYHEHKLSGNVLGVAWDGTGYGTDGNIWGGEFFIYDGNSAKHIAQFEYFPLPGGEIAIKEPRRSALGLLYSFFGYSSIENNYLSGGAYNQNELSVLARMLTKSINSPLTSSVGRIFDAVASLLGLNQVAGFEGEAAMQVEFCADENEQKHYSYIIQNNEILKVNLKIMLEQLMQDRTDSLSTATIAGKFHNTLVAIIYDISKRVNMDAVVLSGGCFQNQLLLKKTVELLLLSNKQVYWNRKIPTNDGGISFGQAAYTMVNYK